MEEVSCHLSQAKKKSLIGVTAKKDREYTKTKGSVMPPEPSSFGSFVIDVIAKKDGEYAKEEIENNVSYNINLDVAS